MQIYGGVNRRPGEELEIEFETPRGRIRIAGIVRSRTGFSFGIEFSAVRTTQEGAGHD